MKEKQEVKKLRLGQRNVNLGFSLVYFGHIRQSPIDSYR